MPAAAGAGAAVGAAAAAVGAAAAGDDQGVVLLGLHIGKRGVEREVVAGLFAIGLCAFEVVDGGLDLVAGLFVGADGVHGMAHGQQGLERDHGFIVLTKIAAQHENLFARHDFPPSC